MYMQQKLYIAALLACDGIGPKTFLKIQRNLKKQNADLSYLWEMDHREISMLGIGEKTSHQFYNHTQAFNFEKLQKKLNDKQLSLLTPNDQKYPTLLKQIPNKPELLYVQGNIDSINTQPIAVVGTRRITSYGKMVTRKFVTELSEEGCSIVSGFMYGVDAVAHTAALDSQGYTVGVLGFGFDYMTPKSHRKLAERVLENGGALLSEFHCEQKPVSGNFPRRNRIVAGLSLGVLVTEAAAKSGSKITAQYAQKYGRKVFSVPGSIINTYSEGTKDLINNGAILVTKAYDILETFAKIKAKERKPFDASVILQNLKNTKDRAIVQQLISMSMNADDLSRQLHIDIVTLQTRLSVLEMQSIIFQENGKWGVVV